MADALAPRLEQEAPKEVIDLEQLKGASTAFVLEASVAMQAGKLQPLGYDVVAEFFRNEHGRTTPAHNVLLLVEAQLSDRNEDAKTEFPDADRLSQLIVRDMQDQHPDIVSRILARVSKPDWSIKPAIQQQEAAADLFQALFRNSPPTRPSI